MRSKNNLPSKPKKKKPVLSNKQNIRLGGLIAVLCDREPYPNILKDLEEGGFITYSEGKISLTEGGNREIDRLCTLSGLMVAREAIINQPV